MQMSIGKRSVNEQHKEKQGHANFYSRPEKNVNWACDVQKSVGGSDHNLNLELMK